MAYRAVAHIVYDEQGDISMLCNYRETWSPRIAEFAIKDIENGAHFYYMNPPDDQPGLIEISVIDHPDKGKVLQAVEKMPTRTA